MKNIALWYEKISATDTGVGAIPLEPVANVASLSETSTIDKASEGVAPNSGSVAKPKMIKAEIHFNFWRVPKLSLQSKVWNSLQTLNPKNFLTEIGSVISEIKGYIRVKDKNFHRALDIGIKVDEIDDIENICFFIPDPTISNDDIEDLGASITSNIKLLNAVFNENVNLSKDFAKSYATVSLVSKDSIHTGEQFTIAIFNDAEYYKLENKYNGKILKISTKGHKGKFYVRFRLKKESIFDPISLEKPNDSVFQSALTLDEIIDFRFNEVRGLPEKLFADISNHPERDKYFQIRKIHFLYICNSKEEFVLGHQDFSSCRLLENDIWRDYVDGLNINDENFVAYHWKEKADETDENDKVDSFNAFIKTRFKHSNWSVILVYVGIILALGILTNLIYDILKEYFKTTEIFSSIKQFLNL